MSRIATRALASAIAASMILRNANTFDGSDLPGANGVPSADNGGVVNGDTLPAPSKEGEAGAPVLTKAERLAKIDAQIAKLQQRRYNVENDIVAASTKQAPKSVYVPSVGDKVLATVGRNTASTQAKVVGGTVIAIREPEVVDGKTKGATQVRVRINEGTFEEQIVTLYPAQLQQADSVDVVNANNQINAAGEGAVLGDDAVNANIV